MSRKTTHNNPGALKSRLATLLGGVSTALAASRSITIAGETLTATEIAQRLAAHLLPIEVAEAARVRASQSVQAREAASHSARSFAEALEAALRGALGPTNASLEQFGLKPKRPRARRSSPPG